MVFKKIGLLILNEDSTKFLVCEKYPKDVTTDFLMPGGKLEASETDEECLKREIKEELSCEADSSELQYVGDYEDVAAGQPDKIVHIKLYRGNLVGTLTSSGEIKSVHWIGKEDVNNQRVSPIIRNKIIPNLVKRGILK